MRGELFWAELQHTNGETKRRPVLEVSAIELISPIVIPVTSIIRDLPSEVQIDCNGINGVLNTLAAGPIRRENLTESIGFVEPKTLQQLCSAISWTLGC